MKGARAAGPQKLFSHFPIRTEKLTQRFKITVSSRASNRILKSLLTLLLFEPEPEKIKVVEPESKLNPKNKI